MATINPTFTNGADAYTADVAANEYILNFLDGADTLNVIRGSVTASMGLGDDIVAIRGGSSTVHGDAGNDLINFYGGSATVTGDAGSDRLIIRSGGSLTADLGDNADRVDLLAAVSGIDVSGGAGDDDFFGNETASSGTIHGDAGNDYFVGFGAGMNLYGGTGNDVYRLSVGSTASFVEAAGEGTDSVQVARGASYTLGANLENISVQGFAVVAGPTTLTGNDLANVITTANIDETINGGGGDDRLFAKGGDDFVNGGYGNDYVDGGTGNDTLSGNDGDDILQGRAGEDVMIGGYGNDTYYVDSFYDSVVEAPLRGTDTVRLSVLTSYTLDANVENLIVSNASDCYLVGNDGANAIYGDDGADSVFGRNGNDTLNGRAGDDYLSGEVGVDVLLGGLGNDQLTGGIEADSLTGGAGNDSFLLTQDDMGQSGFETITDFMSTLGSGAEDDVISFAQIDANMFAYGDQSFTYIGQDPFSGTPGELRYSDFTTNPDGTADVVFEAFVGAGLPPLEVHVHLLSGTFYEDDLVL